MRFRMMVLAVAALAACGGPRVTGDISRACLDADRRAASPALCSCIQRVANQSLSARDQARAAAFFEDPQRAQDTRQADGRSNEAFWERYRSFSRAANGQCSSFA